MIAFDTNIIVRLLVQDDLEQAAEAERLLREAAEAGETVFLADQRALDAFRQTSADLADYLIG